MEALEEAGSSSSGMPVPVSLTVSTDLAPLHPLPDGDLPLEGELQGVGEEVEDDPLPHVPVDVDRLAQVRSVDLELEPRALEGRAEASCEVPGVAGEVGGAERRVGPARLEPRELQQRVHQPLKAQRVAADQLQLATGVLGEPGRAAELVQRAEQEGERGPELVADVVEEGGLRPIELGQRLGPPLLLLEGPGGLDRRGQRSADQLEERPVRLVEGDHRAAAEHQEPAPARDALPDGHHPPPRTGELAGGQVLGASGLPHPPGAGGEHRRERLDLWPLQPHRHGWLGPLLAQLLVERPRHVGGALPQRLHRHRERVRLGAAHRGDLRQPAQRAGPAGGEHLRRRLHHRAEDAADLASLLADRAVGEGEVALLREALPLQREHQVLGEGGLSPREHRVEHGPDDVPDLRPALAPRLSQGRGMLPADEVPVGVVVEHHQLRSPPHEHRHPGVEADAHRGAEALRPPRRVAQRRQCPVLAAHVGAQLPATGEEVERRVRTVSKRETRGHRRPTR